MNEPTIKSSIRKQKVDFSFAQFNHSAIHRLYKQNFSTVQWSDYKKLRIEFLIGYQNNNTKTTKYNNIIYILFPIRSLLNQLSLHKHGHLAKVHQTPLVIVRNIF